MKAGASARARPIIFSGESVRAILDGRKTQTRRALRTDLPFDAPARFAPCDHPEGYGFFDTDQRWHRCPFGRPGDRLWVREAWRIGAWNEDECAIAIDYRDGPRREWLMDPNDHDGERFNGLWIECCDELSAKGIEPTASDDCSEPRYHWKPGESPLRWRSPIHMPRWASRITLEVVSVRVERLQAITEADAKAEGVAPAETTDGDLSHALGYIDTWDALNAKRGHPWDENPWVWVVEFKKVEEA